MEERLVTLGSFFLRLLFILIVRTETHIVNMWQRS